MKGPRDPLKRPRGPFKGPRGPFKGPRCLFLGPPVPKTKKRQKNKTCIKLNGEIRNHTSSLGCNVGCRIGAASEFSPSWQSSVFSEFRPTIVSHVVSEQVAELHNRHRSGIGHRADVCHQLGPDFREWSLDQGFCVVAVQPRCPLKGPRGPFKGPGCPFKGPRGPFKGPRGSF